MIALYGLVADPAQVAESLKAARPLLPSDVFAMFEGQVAALIDARTSSLGVASLVSLALALWSARAGVTALMEGLNVAYRETDTRRLVVQYLLSLALTLLLVVIAIVALLAVVAVPTLLHFSDIGALGALLAQVTPLLILGVAVVFVIGVLYRYGPHRALARKRWVTVGAVLATVGWVIVSLGLSVYVARFADFNRTYGALGAIVGLLFWLYASAFVVLLGAEVNAETELETERDTTTGPPRPLGERGAYVATTSPSRRCRRGSSSRPAAPASSSSPPRRGLRRRERRRRRAAHPLRPPHLLLAPDPGERRPECPRRPRGLARAACAARRRPGPGLDHPPGGRAGRHARAPEGGALADLAGGSGQRRPARAGHLAGHLPVGAPGAPAPARGGRPPRLKPRRRSPTS